MLAELVRYADGIPLTGREPFRQRPVHWFIELDEAGDLRGFTPTTAASTARKSGSVGEKRGKRFSVPANYLLGSPNDSNWQPDFLSGPAEEISPAGVDGNQIFRLRDVINERKKLGKKHPDRNRLRKLGLWRRLIFRCQRELPANPTIGAVASFIRNARQLDFQKLPLSETGDARERLLEEFRKGNETISFRVAGKIAFQDADLKKWWEEKVFPAIHEKETGGFVAIGADAFQPGTGRLTASSPCVFGNVPLVSFNNAPFASFGLAEETACLRLDTVEKAAAALNVLRQDENTSLTLGDETAIFWAVQGDRSVDCSFVALLEAADPLAVADYLKSVWGGVPRELDQARFHVAILLEGTGRFSVRAWNSGYLGDVDRKLRDYFEAIRLPFGNPVNLGAMARATIPKTKKDSSTKPGKPTYNAIFEAAWRGTPLPSRLLESTVTRQCLELAKGRAEDDKGEFESRLRARTALAKLYFKTNGNDIMNEQTHDSQNHPAYLCGRVLALMDRIHNAAHGKSTVSSPAGRYYGSASSTPALVFPRLCKLARIHIEKIENKRWAASLDRDLSALISKFSSQASWPRTLPLEDQGRFAIGFYYERSLRSEAPAPNPDQAPSASAQSNS
jgi:CRISPR-associated protein Cas8c/Csd1 subtype I-C